MSSADTKAALPADPLLSLFGMFLAFSIQQQLCIAGQTLQAVCQSLPKAFHLPVFLWGAQTQVISVGSWSTLILSTASESGNQLDGS